MKFDKLSEILGKTLLIVFGIVILHVRSTQSRPWPTGGDYSDDTSRSQATHLVYTSQALRAWNDNKRLPSYVTERLIHLRLHVFHSPATAHKRTRRSARGGKRKRSKFRCVALCESDPQRSINNIPNGDLLTSSLPVPVQNVTKNLRICHINARSSRNKTHKIKDAIDDMDIDIMCISETWLYAKGDDVKKAELKPPGYEIVSTPRIVRGGGGLAFIYREPLATKDLLSELPYSPVTYEASFSQLKIDNHNVLLTCVYYPGYSKKHKYSRSKFLHEFCELVILIRNKYTFFIICGDLNLHLDVVSDADTKLFNDCIINEHDLKQLVSSSTQQSGHILDVVIVPNIFPVDIDVSVIDKVISDHYLIVIDIKAGTHKRPKKTVISRNIKGIDISLFKKSIGENIQKCSDDSECIFKALRSTMDYAAPLRSRTVTERPTSPWFSHEVKLLKRSQRQAERRWRKSTLQVHKDIFVQTRDAKLALINKLKKEYYINKFESATSCKEMFVISNNLFGNTKSSPLPDGDDLTVSENFISFFSDKISKIRVFIDKQQSVYEQFDVFSGNHFSAFLPVTNEDVRTCILKCSTKSCVLDPIPTNLLKECIDVLIPSITQIFNVSLSTGIVPVSFKEAILMPLLKSASLDQNVLNNYRPVSNLPFLSKVLEKIVISQLMNHITINGLHETFQSAYKALHSTETALLKVTSDIFESLDRQEVCILTLLDLSAAFDTIDHSILLKRLRVTFGISGTVITWFESYLSERTQRVSVGNSYSKDRPLLCGVPQGSVLGPILFTLYTQPLSNIFKKFGVLYHLYADDTQIYLSGSVDKVHDMMNTLSDCIAEVKLWMSTNKLKLNDDKTDVILFTNEYSCNDTSSLPSILKLDDTSIKISDKVKNLGVIFDRDMRMSSFISNVCRNVYLQIRTISHIRDFISEDVAKKLVTSFVLSKLDYCNSLFVGLSDNQIKRLQVAQNSAARLIKRQGRRCHITPILYDLHWLPVQQRIQYKICFFCF